MGDSSLMDRVCFITLSFIVLAHGLPVNKVMGQTKDKQGRQLSTNSVVDVPGLDMQEYVRYMEEMARDDPTFYERLNKVKDIDMKKLQEAIARNPHLQDRLAQAFEGNQGVQGMRNQYDEARRVNLEKIKELMKIQKVREDAATMKSNGEWNRKPPLRDNIANLPNGYTNNDIQDKLQEARRTLEKLDIKRREDFKVQEMWKEHQRRQRLTEMDEQHRLLAEEEYRKAQEKLKHHEKLPQPGSKEQMEQVWEEEDGMPVEQFDPKTFFHMHDTNGDKNIDQIELEALFLNELKKVYGDKEISGLEAHEDMARMREYAMSKIDSDKNGLVSYNEFMKYMKENTATSQEEYHPIVDEEAPFSDQEFQEYEDDYDINYDYQFDDKGNVIGLNPRNPPSPPAVNEEAIQANEQEHNPVSPQLPGGDTPFKGDPAVAVAVDPVVQVEDPNSIHVKPATGVDEKEAAGAKDTTVVAAPGQL